MKVAFLLHENERTLERSCFFARLFVEPWRALGIEVEVVYGPSRRVAADVLFPQIDLTVIPEDYRRVIDEHPLVINRELYDISKRRVSSHLVDRAAPGDLPVIVKTNRNHSGTPEKRLGRWRLAHRLVSGLERRAARLFPGSHDYRIYEHPSGVPASIWARPDLVVERFLPEREGDLYFLRTWTFFGSRGLVTRTGGPEPIVKARNIVVREDGGEPPPELVAFRERWKMDYGKIDFVVHDGVPIILDLNPTPSAERTARIESIAARLAGAIDDL